MDATASTVVEAAIAILVAIGTSFRTLRDEMRAQGDDLRKRIDAQSEQMACSATGWPTSRASARPSAGG